MKKMTKKLVACVLALAMGTLLFSGCSSVEQAPDADLTKEFSEPAQGEEVAVLKIRNMGDITVRFFPDEAPKAVKNFIELSKQGYYDGVTFHRVIEDFMIQGGDPRGDGTGGTSIYGEGFEVETSSDLYAFRGALMMARSSLPNSNGSQFFIVQASNLGITDDYFHQIEMVNQQNGQGVQSFPENVKEKYKEVGGYPSLDGLYTVFGFVIDGLDIVDQIASVETDSNDKPLDSVIVDKVEIISYQG